MLLVLYIMSIINFRASECSGSAMGGVSAATGSELAADGASAELLLGLWHCEAVQWCKQISWALG